MKSLRNITLLATWLAVTLLSSYFWVAFASEVNESPYKSIDQRSEISGKVTDANTGEALVGVDVHIKGTSRGTVTNFDGEYKIDAEPSGVLVFSYLGYETKEVSVENNAMIDVGLAPSSDQLDEIVLTGIRAAQQRAVAIKRLSPVFADAITSEDAGKFPDGNISEALQRVSGVAIQRTRGQGDFVSIRGLGPEFVRGSINGRTLVSATESFNPVLSGGLGSSTGRATNFDVLPSEIIESVEVFKSNAAEHVEGGLAGTVNIKTAKPLKLGKKFGLSAKGSNYEFAGETNPSLSTFGSLVNRTKTFGFVS